MADELTAGGVPVYRDTGGVLREIPQGVGANAAATLPAIAATYSIDTALDGYNAAVIKTGSVYLLSIDAYNARTGGVRINFYDQATTPNTDTTPAKWSVYLPPLNSTGRDYPAGIRFDTGLAIALIPDDASGLMAGDIQGLNIGYSA